MLTYFLIGIKSQYICEKYISAVIKKAYLKDRHIKCVICDFGDSSFISPVEEAVRELKKECPEIELCIVMPFLPLEDEYLELLDKKTEGRCDSVLLPSGWLDEAGIYSQIRRAIIEQLVVRSDMLIINAPIAVGFLAQMVKLANSMGIEVHNIYFDMLHDEENSQEP